MSRISHENQKSLIPGLLFYTYIHSRASDKKVFYVGKGKLNRAWSKDGRSVYWKRVTKKHGLRVDICSSWADEQDAFSHERLLIQTFKDIGHPVINSTAGGEGASGYKWSADQLAAVSLSRSKFLQTEAGQKIRQGWSKGQTERMRDPAFKAALVGPLTQWTADPANRKAVLDRMAQARLVGWSSENKAIRVQRLRECEQQTGAAHRRAKAIMETHGAKIHAGRDAHFAIKENRKVVGDRMRNYYADPANMATHKARIAKRMSNPAVRAEMSRSQGGKPFMHIQSGTVYQTQIDASRATRISQSAISNVLHGKKTSVNGQSFRYIQGEEA